MHKQQTEYIYPKITGKKELCRHPILLKIKSKYGEKTYCLVEIRKRNNYFWCICSTACSAICSWQVTISWISSLTASITSCFSFRLLELLSAAVKETSMLAIYHHKAELTKSSMLKHSGTPVYHQDASDCIFKTCVT